MLSIQGAIAQQYYEWLLPESITYLGGNEHKSQIQIMTSGLPCIAEVRAYAINSCGTTDTVSTTLTIDTVKFSLVGDIGRRYTYILTDPEVLEDTIKDVAITNYAWYLNDELYEEGEDAYELSIYLLFLFRNREI